MENDLEMDKVMETLNFLLEHELAGVVKYTHYSLMVYGPNRIPIVTWLRQQGQESLKHAEEVGECITSFGGQPSLDVGDLPTVYRNSSVKEILQESVKHEETAIRYYRQLLDQTKDKSIFLEELARKFICLEEGDLAEVNKMLRDFQ